MVKIVVASHRRSGTHLTIDSLRQNLGDVCKDYITLDRLEPGQRKHLAPDAFREALRRLDGIPILKTHAMPSLLRHGSLADELIRNSKVIYVYRDGRDVLVSLYHYAKKCGMFPAEETFQAFLRSDDNFYPALNLSRVMCWVRHINEWIGEQELLAIAYEALLEKPEATLETIAEYLGLPLVKAPRLPRMPKSRIGKLISGSTAVDPRKGIVGDWKSHFSADDVAEFDTVAHQTMTRLGYG